MDHITDSQGSGAARLEGYVGQTELGKALGLSSQNVGKLLEALGLKEGREPTPYALRVGASTPPLTGRAGAETYTYCMWKPEIVIPMLRAIA